MFSREAAIADINERNRLRRKADLPALDLTKETEKIEAVCKEAEFGVFFQKESRRYRHLWSDQNRGWTTNMGIYVSVRNRLRRMFHRNERD